MSTRHDNPDQYVREHKDELVEIFKHGDDKFVRALALTALVEYGGEPAVWELQQELDRMADREGHK